MTLGLLQSKVIIYMDECLFRHKNNARRSLLRKKKYKITKYTIKYISVEYIYIYIYIYMCIYIYT